MGEKKTNLASICGVLFNTEGAVKIACHHQCKRHEPANTDDPWLENGTGDQDALELLICLVSLTRGRLKIVGPPASSASLRVRFCQDLWQCRPLSHRKLKRRLKGYFHLPTHLIPQEAKAQEVMLKKSDRDRDKCGADDQKATYLSALDGYANPRLARRPSYLGRRACQACKQVGRRRLRIRSTRWREAKRDEDGLKRVERRKCAGALQRARRRSIVFFRYRTSPQRRTRGDTVLGRVRGQLESDLRQSVSMPRQLIPCPWTVGRNGLIALGHGTDDWGSAITKEACRFDGGWLPKGGTHLGTIDAVLDPGIVNIVIDFLASPTQRVGVNHSKNYYTGNPNVRFATILGSGASLELTHKDFECKNVALRVGVEAEAYEEYAEGEYMTKKGGERKPTRGPALRGAVNWPKKASRALCQRIENLPGWVLGWRNRALRCVRERCVVWGGDGTEDIERANVDRSAQWFAGWKSVVALSWPLLPLPRSSDGTTEKLRRQHSADLSRIDRDEMPQP
ncbi:hypothetical protein V8E53_007694 [Lactarius tabidus]